MKKILKVHFQRILSLFVLCVLCVAMFMGGQMTALPAFADTELNYDQTNALDDLSGATIGGKPFNLSDYPYNERGKPQIIAFTEYAYSFYSDNQGNYGLYVYVYNPQGLAFDTDSDRNKIELAYAEKDNWDLYELQFLNYSTRAGYEGLFYKFKVVLTDEKKSDILSSVNANSRVYEIVGIELSVNDIVTDYTVAMRYTYSGYSLGYGSALATTDSLSCDTDGFEEYLNLDVHTTYYRPDGTNGENRYTQDSLHSAYFAVPKETVEEYGALSAVHATWLDAVLAPVLVTGNEDAYNAIEKYLGQNVGINNSSLSYAYLGACESNYVSGGAGSAHDIYTSDFGYNMVEGRINESWVGSYYDEIRAPKRRIDTLYWLFSSGFEDDSADSYVLSSEEIQKKLVEFTEIYGGELVNSRYSRVLFDSVADEFTNINIPAEYEYDLRSEVLGSSWWDKLWGITHDESDAFDGIRAIEAVSDNDFVKAGGIIDIPATCDNLYIAEQDFAEFKSFYDKNKNDCVIYLFRYQVSDYIAQEATLFEGSGESWSEVDTNAYFMQETINLDFNIIDVTFTKDNVSTVIPVVANPVDNVPDGTPPVYTTDDVHASWWAYVILVVGEVLILWLLQILFVKLCGLPMWVMIILVAVTAVLDIFFIQTWAAGITELLSPYLGWLPFS